MGLSGSLVKNAVKEPSTGMFEEAPSTEPAEEPEVTKVLVGECCPKAVSSGVT